MLLPIAMQRRQSLHIAAAVDSQVLENARKLMQVWEIWLPETFRSVDLSADAEPPDPIRADRTDARLFFYSGGVDSTHMLVQPGVLTAGSHAVTIHGIDYKPDAHQAFADFMTKTTPLTERLALRRIIVRTNLGQITRNLALNHGFCLAGTGFLFRELFTSCHLAHDYTHAQSMLAFPWGTNYVTNAYFRGTDYKLTSMDADISRTQKVGFLATKPELLETITFCVNPSTRPENCGRCDKCVRTKAMFIVEHGSVPPIFMDSHFERHHTRSLNFNSRKEVAFFTELFARARAKGNQDQLLDLPHRYEVAVTRLRGSRLQSRVERVAEKLRKKSIWLRR
jgi:7-cyano-7-deazaguanine synthase in queuosine biosynthesis